MSSILGPKVFERDVDFFVVQFVALYYSVRGEVMVDSDSTARRWRNEAHPIFAHFIDCAPGSP